VDFEQPIRDMDAEIGVDPDELGVKGRMMDLISGKPFETIGCPNCSSASMMMWAASRSRGSGRWEIAHLPP
jgi:hypothetical protein